MTNNQLTENSVTQLLNNVRLARDNAERDDNRVDHSFYYALARALEELQERRKAVIDSEPVRNPVLAYADSYRDMAKQGVESVPIWSVITDLERNIAPLYRHAQPAPVVPEGLNPETTDLVLRFASALADKLYKAEQKYGRSTDWMKDDWYDDCLQSLWEHIEKGDPRDVAAYCAFMWYHGWVTTDYDRNVQNACRAAMLQAGNSPVHSGLRPEQNIGSPAQSPIDHGNSPVIPDCWIPVSERMPDVGVKVLCFPVKDEPIHAIFNGQLWLQDVSWSGSDDPIDNVIPVSVTHWMPLPADPQEVKGE